MTTPNFLTLIKQIENADGPSRALDRNILRTISGQVVRDETFIYGAKHGTREIETVYPWRWACWFAPRYTGVTDLAMSLLPAGIVIIDLELSWDTQTPRGHPACSVRWYPPDRNADGKNWHACTTSAKAPALAVCAAALSIRSRIEEAGAAA